MYKNIIFDLGNVLLEFNPKEYLENKIPGEKVEDVYKAIFKSEEWAMLDRGTITQEEAIKNICDRNSSCSHEIILAFKDWYDILSPIMGTVEVLSALKDNGYNIYYLSNFHELAFHKVTKVNKFFELFDGGVVSYAEKLLKPEKEIYKMILDRYKLNPSETIFVDDMEANVEGAKKLGIKAILFKDAKKLKEELNNLNIKI
ncbi:MAG: HAD family phosphatase [Clostridium sartagoforme]|nr:HAD family phosphatase [Clostridium sartagoforme]